MLDDVRAAVSAREGDIDWDQNPLILSWPELFHGTAEKVGFEEARPEGQQATFRFICAGMGYFEDETDINDDGQFVPAQPANDNAIVEINEAENENNNNNNLNNNNNGNNGNNNNANANANVNNENPNEALVQAAQAAFAAAFNNP